MSLSRNTICQECLDLWNQDGDIVIINKIDLIADEALLHHNATLTWDTATAADAEPLRTLIGSRIHIVKASKAAMNFEVNGPEGTIDKTAQHTQHLNAANALREQYELWKANSPSSMIVTKALRRDRTTDMMVPYSAASVPPSLKLTSAVANGTSIDITWETLNCPYFRRMLVYVDDAANSPVDLFTPKLVREGLNAVGWVFDVQVTRFRVKNREAGDYKVLIVVENLNGLTSVSNVLEVTVS